MEDRTGDEAVLILFNLWTGPVPTVKAADGVAKKVVKTATKDSSDNMVREEDCCIAAIGVATGSCVVAVSVAVAVSVVAVAVAVRQVLVVSLSLS